ncbi:hypothetical protein ABB37_07935 [Leptomonas pyrrhocoris]|uniref:Uncharacterized protein n=1 Tax=Leptomonas pyrrhocoris TaxID=157538 RepID=A0A0M9FU72_LEPPY|nr:hypothetical protein ABB37_07935 [Leptomonas pyrrhocoris]KPA76175.1 hypothetical protein ABB37_07935 [Leptomonas pyrrhocoris]|eukprot:XP_015654614.1 hypothetical protein ABB37_07935 [Leptomonas pyrrhocoris]
MSDTTAPAIEVPVPFDESVSAEKGGDKAAMADTVDLDGVVSNEIGGDEAKSVLTQDAGRNAALVETHSDGTADANVPPASADATAPASEDLPPAKVNDAPTISAHDVGTASAAVQAELNDIEGTKRIQGDGEAKGTEENKVEAPQNADVKENCAADVPKEGATEDAKGELTSPNSLPKQKASFNIDAKPFSPGTLADPAMQRTLVSDPNGLSIKVGQWGNQPFVPMPHISPVAPVSVGQVPFAVPGATQPPSVRKEGPGVKESLSAFAKPWSPHPEVTVAPIPPPENEVAIHPGSWTVANVEGKDIQTPSPMVPKDMSSNSYAHSYSIHPKGLKNVELELFNYVCGRCPLKTLYGRLSSRQPDVTMRNVAMDVPPLCVSHLIEQVTKAKVTALCVNEMEGSHYDIWLDKPNMAPVLLESMSDCVWTCPMFHGFAVVGKGEEGKKYLRNYVERLNDSRPEGSNVCKVALVEVKEH